MKKKFLAIAAAAVLLLAAGCSAEEPAAEQNLYNGKTYDACLAEMKAANRTLHLLESYGDISSVMEVADGEGKSAAQIETHYTRSEEGYLLFSHREAYEGSGTPIVINAFADDTHPGAYYMSSGDFKSMILYPSDEYETFIANDSALDMTLLGYMEYAEAIEESDGTLLITSILSNGQTGENSRVIYTADAKTLELQERKITTYSEDGELTSQSLTVYTYDAGTETDYAAAEAVLGAGDSCSLTAVLFDGDAQMEVQNFKVSKDVKVQFQTAGTYKIYSDENLKKKAKSIDVSGDRQEIYIVMEDGE